MVKFASSFLSVLVFSCAVANAIPISGGNGQQGKNADANAGNGGAAVACNAAKRHLLTKAQAANKALQQVAAVSQSDKTLLDAVTTAGNDLKGAVAGVANVSAAVGANAAATPQGAFDAITTDLDSANTALAGAQAPAASMAGLLLKKAQKSLNQTVAAGADVVNKCGGAVATATNTTTTDTAAASATYSATSTIANSTAAVTDVAETAAASTCPPPVTVTVSAGAASNTTAATSTVANSTTIAASTTVAASITASASSTAIADKTGASGTKDDLPTGAARRLRSIFMGRRAL